MQFFVSLLLSTLILNAAASSTLNFGRRNFHSFKNGLTRSWHPYLTRSRVSARDTEADIQTLFERRKARVIGTIYDAGNITNWMKTLGTDGKWPDTEVNYATQCAAQRANWPAYEHWRRIVTMSSAYAGIPGVGEWAHNDDLQAGISRAMDWWFARDFNANPQCQDAGGTTLCPCDPAVTPAEWMFNTNWFSNIILIPRLVGQACLLMNETLSAVQFSNCTTMTTRSYANFFHKLNSGSTSGANLLDIANIGIDGGILSSNVTQLTDAYNRIHSAIAIVNGQDDGIHQDGSFGQHSGLLYNGNYGKDYTNAVMNAEVASAGTQWAAASEQISAFETLFSGDKWMIYRNIITKVLHWDISTYPRFIAFSIYDDRQSPSSILLNLTEVKTLGKLWDSNVLTSFADDLAPNKTNANAGGLVGHNVFYTNDYVVSRGKNYVSTLKMFSSRTRNSECVNSGNVKGFHLADGATYTYVNGTEYEEVAQAWDWELIPGTTSDYGGTELICANSNNLGLSDVVGGASNGKTAAAAMTYTNPITKALSWRKSWFYLDDDVQYVVVSNISSTNGKTIFSTLDQKKHSGDVKKIDLGNSVGLWHDKVGYVVPKSKNFDLSYKTETRQGNWSALGTSVVAGTTVDMFTAKIEHKNHSAPLSYAVFPGVDFNTFKSKSRRQVSTLVANDNATVVYDKQSSTAFFTFWTGSNCTAVEDHHTQHKLSSSNAAVGFVNLRSGNLVVADPTQKATSIRFTLNGKSKTIQLPTGREAGKSATSNIYH